MAFSGSGSTLHEGFMNYVNIGQHASTLSSHHIIDLPPTNLVLPPVSRVDDDSTKAGTTRIELQQILTDSNIEKFDDPDRKLLDHMRKRYFYLMDDLHGQTWNYRIESFNIKAGYLASLATVSTFLGAMQVSLVAFSATVLASNTVHQVTYFFSYCGLSFDAFGAIFALFTSGSLLSLTSKAKALASEELDEETKYQLVAFKNLCDNNTTAELRLNEEMRNRFKDFSTSCEKKHDEAQRLAFVIKHHLQDVFDIIWVTGAGVTFFFVSLITFIVGTQPTGVKASSIAAIGLSGLGLLYMQVYRHPGIRRRLKKAWRSKFHGRADEEA